MSTSDYSTVTITPSYVPNGAFCIQDTPSTGPGFALTTASAMYVYDLSGAFIGAGGAVSNCQGHFVLMGDGNVWTTVATNESGVFALCHCPLNVEATNPFLGSTTLKIDGLSSSRLCVYDETHLILAGAPNEYILLDTTDHSYTRHTMKSYSAYFTRPYDEDAVIAFNGSGYEVIRGTVRTQFYEELDTEFFTYPCFGYVDDIPNAFTDSSTLTKGSFEDKPTGESSAHFTSIQCPSLMREIEALIMRANS
ncbi:hypothetical protein KIPB_005194 [Kipferlia bialata]|uniref:Uncharacterized protein n=1 Tax=Kipferlia bialata TaxID=797122 RepID=A0A391NL69_9EUKA|nr:hypothetical protein KIPB_005194 [Kipferlia bialata]|eukprot:g5194.t1